MLKGKKIILGVTGSIAAYKSAYLTRLLVKESADVLVIMTPAAKEFISPLTLATLSNNPVLCDAFIPVTGKWNSHVEFGNWADLMLIAPLSANTIGKMANGVADNLLLTTYLSARCPVYFAPAMDLEMYKHPSVQKNITTLKSFNNILISPAEGELASHLHGVGRMQEPEKIVEIIKEAFIKKDLLNKKVLVSAGPTYEAIDPVRFIGNKSSGLMGFSIAEAFAQRGAEVFLVAGPTNLNTSHSNIQRINVLSAEDMYNECIRLFPEMDITVMAAAVADYTLKAEKQKMKKTNQQLTLLLEATKDILYKLGTLKKENQILVGFALETDNEIENAKFKLKNKNLDYIILNSLNDKCAGFNFDTNKIKIINREFEISDYPLMKKKELATEIINKITCSL